MESIGPIAGLSAAACWAVASVLYTRVPIGAGAMTTFKNCFATVFLFFGLWALANSRGQPMFQASLRSWYLLGISGVIGLWIADIAYFRSIQILGPRQGVTLTLLTPPSTALLSWIWLGESLSIIAALAIAITLSGIAVVMSEQASDEAPLVRPGSRRLGVTSALIGIATMAVGAVFLRQGTAGVDAVEATFIRLFVSSVFGLIYSMCLGQVNEIRELIANRKGILQLCAASFLGTVIGVWLMVIAYKYCFAGIAATLTSTAPLFIIPVVAIVLRHRVSRLAIAGAIVAFGGVCLLLVTVHGSD